MKLYMRTNSAYRGHVVVGLRDIETPRRGPSSGANSRRFVEGYMVACGTVTETPRMYPRKGLVPVNPGTFILALMLTGLADREQGE
jgi:hypothetical protein